MNLIEATLVREQGRVAVRVALADGPPALLTLPAPERLAAYPRTDVVLGLRPEALTDAAGSAAAAPLEHIHNRVDVVEPTGSDTYVVTRLGGTDAVARLRAEAVPRAGAAFRFAIDMTKCVPFDPRTELRIG